MSEVVQRWEMPIRNEDDVILVRRKARTLAQERGFDAFATAALTTAASELARNVLVHGSGGPEFAALIAAETAKWARVVQLSGVKVDR